MLDHFSLRILKLILIESKRWDQLQTILPNFLKHMKNKLVVIVISFISWKIIKVVVVIEITLKLKIIT